ncbi:MAG TPA: alpha/beta hydrolase [Anaeromyxobacter sp.]|nr:alpha/beta hydrolase [Anaeromyxobacter sp.]
MPELRLGEAIVRFEDEGRGAPVLLVHGFPTTRLLWRGVGPLLVEAGFRVVVPDLVGYGDSSCPPGVEPDMASQAGWMLSLLDALGIARAAIVAHDVGTAAAQLLVARAPERARALVLMDGVHGAEWAMDAVAPILSWAEPARLFPVLVRRVRTGGPVRLDEEVVREVLAPYRGDVGGARLVRAARALDPAPLLESTPALSARRVPARVLWGEHDAYLPAERVGRPLAAMLGADLVTLPGGHFLPLDCPGEVASAVASFLAPLR